MSDTAYVRDAKPGEFEYAAIVYARAFVSDPLHTWMGSVSKPAILPFGQTIDRDTILTMPKHIKTLFHLHHSLILSTQYVGGRVLVTVRPENGEEKIVSVTLWIPPLVKVDGPLTVMHAKQYRTVFGTLQSPLGTRGFKGECLVAISYEKRIQKLQKRLLKSKGIDHSRAWHLLDVATDPDEEGKGYCGKLLRYGLQEIVKDAPVYLEATTPRSRNLYSHLGFEITDTPLFGVKTVTENGLPPEKGQKGSATGVPVWTMVYLKTSNP